MAYMRVRLSWHLAWIKIQLCCVLPLGEALWALIVGCCWETTEEALTALVRSSQCFLEDTLGTSQGSRAVLQVVDEVCQNPVGKIFIPRWLSGVPSLLSVTFRHITRALIVFKLPSFANMLLSTYLVVHVF